MGKVPLCSVCSDSTSAVPGALAGVVGHILRPGSSPWALPTEARQATGVERGPVLPEPPHTEVLKLSQLSYWPR